MLKASEYVRIKHGANPGDLIASLPAIRKATQILCKKAVIYQHIGRDGDYYAGATHPTRDDNGRMVCMNDSMFDMLRPLMLVQHYIADFIKWKGEKIDIDIDEIRQTHVGAPNYNISKWVMVKFPDLACDLGDPWLQTEPTPMYVDIPDIPMEEAMSAWKQTGVLFMKTPTLKGRIIVNLTERYRNPNITYYCLKQYESKVVFAGTQKEYELFKLQWELNVPRLHVDNFLDLAKAIKECAFFIGNQSFPFALSESMKTPRLLEVCSWAPNVDSTGGYHYGYMSNLGLEYHLDLLAAKYL